jgi:hypothetical protein
MKVPNTVHLSSGPELQRDIDALPADVVTLTISARPGEGYNPAGAARLHRALPRLESLQLVDVHFAEVHLKHPQTSTRNLAP